MSILNNLKTLPEIGLRYELIFSSVPKNKYSIRIYKAGYTGTVDTLLGAGDPLTIQQNFGDEDIFTTISGTQFVVSFIAEKYFTYNELRQANSSDYYLIVNKIEGTSHIPIGSGYYVPEMYEQKHGAMNDVITITFTDGLGLLKDYDFKNNDDTTINTRECLADIITFMLNKIGSRGLWVDAIPIRPNGCAKPLKGMLFNSYIDCARFAEVSCYDVLVSILSTTNSQIVQDGSRFLIYNRDFPSMQTGVSYSPAGVAITTGVNVSALEYTIMEHGFVNGGADIRNELAIRDISLKYTKELNENLLDDKTVGAVGIGGAGQWSMTAINGMITMKPWASELWNGNTPYATIQFYRDFPITEAYFKIEFDVMPMAYVNADTTYDVKLAASITKASNNTILRSFFVPINTWSNVSMVIYVGSTTFANMSFNLHTEQTSPLLPSSGKIYYTNYKITAVKNQAGDIYETISTDLIALEEDNSKKLNVEKEYGWETYPSVTTMGPYIWKNILFSKDIGGAFIVPLKHVYMGSGALTSLPDFIKTRLIEYYGFRKMRIGLNVISKNYTYTDYLIKPYTQFIIEHLEQQFVLGSFRWSVKLDLYALELIGYKSSDWILETGYWNDKGVWDDTKLWED